MSEPWVGYANSKGSIQTARRLLPRILRAPSPAATKTEAVFHLTANSAYLLTLVLALLLIPSESKISGTVRGTVLAGSRILYVIGKYAWG